MIRLSIVVPAHGIQQSLEDSLVSVLENRPDGCEIILAHPHTYEDPYDLADELRLVSCANTELLELLNAGISASGGEIIHILCPGHRAERNWCDSALELFEADRNLAAVAPVLVDDGGREIWGATYSPWWGRKLVRRDATSTRPVTPTAQVGFYRASALRFMHGFDASSDAAADVELCLRLWAAGYRTAADPDTRIPGGRVKAPSLSRGFRGGSSRAKLFQLARAAGFMSETGGYGRIMLGELLIHFPRPTCISALAAHLWHARRRTDRRLPLPLARTDTRLPDKKAA